MKGKGFALIGILAAVAGFWYLFMRKKSTSTSTSPGTVEVPASTTPTEANRGTCSVMRSQLTLVEVAQAKEKFAYLIPDWERVYAIQFRDGVMVGISVANQAGNY